MKKILYTSLLSLLITGCIKVEYTAKTTHPNEALITMNVDGISPNAYPFINGVYTENVTDMMLAPGSYSFVAVEQTDQIEPIVKATESTNKAVPIYLIENDGVVTSDVDDIYYGIRNEELYADMEKTIILSTKLATSTLTIKVNVDGGDAALISDVTANLSGLSQGWDLYSDTAIGAAVSCKPSFVVKDGMLTATISLLGVDEDVDQILTMDIALSDGSAPVNYSCDVSDKIVKVNSSSNVIIIADAVSLN